MGPVPVPAGGARAGATDRRADPAAGRVPRAGEGTPPDERPARAPCRAAPRAAGPGGAPKTPPPGKSGAHSARRRDMGDEASQTERGWLVDGERRRVLARAAPSSPAWGWTTRVTRVARAAQAQAVGECDSAAAAHRVRGGRRDARRARSAHALSRERVARALDRRHGGVDARDVHGRLAQRGSSGASRAAHRGRRAWLDLADIAIAGAKWSRARCMCVSVRFAIESSRRSRVFVFPPSLEPPASSPCARRLAVRAAPHGPTRCSSSAFVVGVVSPAAPSESFCVSGELAPATSGWRPVEAHQLRASSAMRRGTPLPRSGVASRGSYSGFIGKARTATRASRRWMHIGGSAVVARAAVPPRQPHAHVPRVAPPADCDGVLPARPSLCRGAAALARGGLCAPPCRLAKSCGRCALRGGVCRRYAVRLLPPATTRWNPRCTPHRAHRRGGRQDEAIAFVCGRRLAATTRSRAFVRSQKI